MFSLIISRSKLSSSILTFVSTGSIEGFTSTLTSLKILRIILKLRSWGGWGEKTFACSLKNMRNCSCKNINATWTHAKHQSHFTFYLRNIAQNMYQIGQCIQWNGQHYRSEHIHPGNPPLSRKPPPCFREPDFWRSRILGKKGVSWILKCLFLGGESPPQAENFGVFRVLKCWLLRGNRSESGPKTVQIWSNYPIQETPPSVSPDFGPKGGVSWMDMFWCHVERAF